MKTRILTALAIIAVVALPVALGGIWLELLALFIVCTGCWEWLHTLPGFKDWGLVLTPFLIALVLLSRLMVPNHTYIYLGLSIGLLWALPVLTEKFTIQDSWSCIAMLVIFMLIYQAIGWLSQQPRYLWTMCFATYGSDTGAYFFGSALGKHRMNPRISPKKSWEGFFGGILAGFLLSWLLSLLYAQTLNSTLNLLLCLLCPVVAELGDLCFSAMKRASGLKDFSNFLPGHGGVLDRVDSLLYNILLFGILFSMLG